MRACPLPDTKSLKFTFKMITWDREEMWFQKDSKIILWCIFDKSVAKQIAGIPTFDIDFYTLFWHSALITTLIFAERPTKRKMFLQIPQILGRSLLDSFNRLPFIFTWEYNHSLFNYASQLASVLMGSQKTMLHACSQLNRRAFLAHIL